MCALYVHAQVDVHVHACVYACMHSVSAHLLHVSVCARVIFIYVCVCVCACVHIHHLPGKWAKNEFRDLQQGRGTHPVQHHRYQFCKTVRRFVPQPFFGRSVIHW